MTTAAGQQGYSRRRLALALGAGGIGLAAGGSAWRLLRAEASPDKPWEAQPLAAYTSGEPPPGLWRLDGIGAPEGPPPVSFGRHVVYTTKGGGIAARKVHDGSAAWHSGEIQAEMSSNSPMLPASGLLLAVDGRGAVLALDPASGRVRWSAPRLHAERLLAADPFTAYVLTTDRHIRALDLKSRRSVWTRNCTVRPPVGASAASGRLVLHGSDGHVSAYDAASGVIVWQRMDLGNGPLKPWAGEGTACLPGKEELLALSLADGEVLWRTAARSSAGAGWGEPLMYRGTVYARDGDELRALGAGDGHETWALQLPASAAPHSLAAPVIQHRTLCLPLDVSGRGGLLFADLDKKTPAWTYARRGSGPWRLSAAGNRIFAARGSSLSALPVI